MEAEKATARHILVDTEEKAIAIKEEIAAGKDFAEAAMESSSCPSKEHGGELGAFSRGQMVKEFEDAAFAATIGELVGPVKTQFGYHLIIVDEITPASVQPLEAVVGQIKQNLAGAKQQQVYLDKVEALKETYPVKVNPEGLK